jgi:hypothetical protein
MCDTIVPRLEAAGADKPHPLARIAGSDAFVALCRSVWLLEVDPNDATRTRRIPLPLKNNRQSALVQSGDAAADL